MIKRNDHNPNDNHVHETPREPLAALPKNADSRGVGEGEGLGSLWSLLNDRLSGRWPHAIVLGLALAAVLAVLGFNATTVKYDAGGVIQVSPKITPLIRDTPETGLMPLYANYLETEARLVTNPRILDRTPQHLDLSETPWQTLPELRRALESNLRAQTERNTELIYVTFRADSPTLAQKVTNAVLRSYDEIRGSVEGDEHGRKINQLRADRNRYREQARLKRNEILELVNSTGYAVTDFRQLIERAELQIQEAEEEIRRAQDALELASTHGRDGAEGSEATVLNERELEMFDAELAQLSRQRHEAKLAYERARATMTPKNHGYVRARNLYEMLSRLYHERAVLVAEDFLASGHILLTNNPADLRLRIEQHQRYVDEQRATTRQMTLWQATIDDLTADLEEILEWQSSISHRIRQLDVEADTIRAGRIRIAAYAEQPLKPSQDRRKPLAMLGAMAGFGMGVGAFFLLGTIDRRVYVARQLTSSTSGGGSAYNRLLGVLPALPQRAGDVEASSVAAHCVHQIRNHIEVALTSDNAARGPRPRGGAILVVSSPYQGDGKTSLVMALGASYAATGCRVLLVDCDLVGKNLTTHSMMSGQPGLREALRTGDVSRYIVPLAHAPAAEEAADNGAAGSASVLPVGNDPTFGPEMIRREKLEAVFAQLRDHYDVIIVDTGPLFGSIETLPAAAAATSGGAGGVVLTMQRGRRHARLEECIDELRDARANYLGLVLNYARISDCDRYVSKSRISAVLTAHEADYIANGQPKARAAAPRASRNALLRAMQVTSRMDS